MASFGGGGIEPRWRGDGKEIFYMLPAHADGLPVSNDNGSRRNAGAVVPKFMGRAPISSTDAFTYDVAKDGKRFWCEPVRIARNTCRR